MFEKFWMLKELLSDIEDLYNQKKYGENLSDPEGIQKERRSHFKKIMAFAESIIDSEHPNRIYGLIYSLGKEYQFKRINDLIKGGIQNNEDQMIEKLFINKSPVTYFFSKEFSDGSTNYKSKVTGASLHPKENLIFTYPWNILRLEGAYLNVGIGVGNEWKHDPYNHSMMLIKPLNIGFMTCGNHSSALNIIHNEAPINITEVIDLKPIYEDIYTDGIFFYYKKDNALIGEATSAEFAAIFEIGRLIYSRKNLLNTI